MPWAWCSMRSSGHGLAENTIVVFTSDNGGVSSGDAFSSSMLPLRGGKGRQWEGGIREPLYIRSPASSAPGALCDVPVTGIDFYRPSSSWLASRFPRSRTVDGESMVRCCKGEADPELSARDLFWHYPHYGNQGGDPSSIIRNGPWKLIHYYEDGHDELYNLEEDAGEQSDVAAAHGDLVADMRARLDAWLKEIGAKLPVPDAEHDPAAEQARLERLEHTSCRSWSRTTPRISTRTGSPTPTGGAAR